MLNSTNGESLPINRQIKLLRKLIESPINISKENSVSCIIVKPNNT